MVVERAEDTDWVVRVCDVYPDGRSFNLADGAVNAKMWSGDSDPKPLVPGTVYEYRLELQKTAVTLSKGHVLRLDFASAAEGFLLTNSNTPDGFVMVPIPGRHPSGFTRVPITLPLCPLHWMGQLDNWLYETHYQ